MIFDGHDESVIITPLISETLLYKVCEYIAPTIEDLLVSTRLEYEHLLRPMGLNIYKIN